jgi:translocation and assembly module TamB
MEAEAAIKPDAPHVRRGSFARRTAIWTGRLVLLLTALLLALVVFLHTPPGRQFLLNQIASYAPASGLSVEVGGIEGSVLWSATFTDVRLRDANDVLFLEVPEVDLGWRPLKWFFTGLDVRHLVLHDGTLHAIPELLPGDPDAPILPDFDIRVDRFVIDNLTVAEGIMGEERVIRFRSRADIRRGHVLLEANGELGGGDQFALLAEAEPDGDIFDLDLDWVAPAGGFLATLVGAEETVVVALEGDGSWSAWAGSLVARQGEDPLLDFDIYNDSGQYRLVGQAFPGDFVEGLTARALGPQVAFTASGTLEHSALEGSFAMRARGFNLDGGGTIDLADNAFDDVLLDAELLDPVLFGTGVALEDTLLSARLDGPFAEVKAPHHLTVGRLVAGTIVLTDLVQQGTLRREGARFVVPLDAGVGRVVSGASLFDPRLVGGRVGGTLALTGRRLSSDDLAMDFPGLVARLGLRADLGTGAVRATGPVRMDRLSFDDVGLVNSNARIDFTIGGGRPWALVAQLDGRVPEVTNATLASVAGGNIRFTGGIALGEARPLAFSNFRVAADRLQASLDGRVEGETTTLVGSGRHVDYGPFTIEATLADDGPRAVLVLADPYPAAGLRDVRLALEPEGDGFAVLTSGQSLLGPFDGVLGITAPEGGPVSILVSRLDVAATRVQGQLRLVAGGVDGGLALAGGGVDGRIGLAARAEGQGFDVELTAREASFGGTTPISIAEGQVDARGFIAAERSLAATTVEGTLRAGGVTYGNMFIGRMAANARVTDGAGAFDAAIAGQRGSRFELLLNGEATSEQVALAVRGSYRGRAIAMPRRAVVARTADGGWQLERAQLSFGGGFVIANGRMGGEEPMEMRLALSDLPLSLADLLTGDIGLGGTVSGVVDLSAGEHGVPVGEARLIAHGLTRSGLLLTSRPVDVALVGRLDPALLQARAVVEDEGEVRGRLDATIANLPQGGALAERLYAGDLRAQLRYDGPAEALWRLAAIDLIDIAGNVDVAADVRGTLGNPLVRGSLAGDGLRVQGSITGTDLSDVSARGRFDGSRLRLVSFSGASPNGGRVVGSGFIDLSSVTADRGPSLDIRLAARNARILQLPGMGATVTGPMRFVSDGVDGTIAGRLQVRQAEWRLGRAAESVDLPDIAITHVNLPPDIAPVRRAARPWRYLVNATAVRGIEVDGMGLDSEWSGEVRLRGTTADPRIGGEVRIVPRQGFYTFAGVRFEITRGRIDFDENVPINPRLDILAEADVDGLDVDVTVRGDAGQPEITFASVPALPEEELMARLLFGGSITTLSATDALQLGAALASLRGGSGLDPINRLRSAIGLDRLRIVPADPALDRGTSVALGKNITRRFYVELITDGQGYNATELEYRVTGWLSLLASINTVGRSSVAAEYSRDY